MVPTGQRTMAGTLKKDNERLSERLASLRQALGSPRVNDPRRPESSIMDRRPITRARTTESAVQCEIIAGQELSANANVASVPSADAVPVGDASSGREKLFEARGLCNLLGQHLGVLKDAQEQLVSTITLEGGGAAALGSVPSASPIAPSTGTSAAHGAGFAAIFSGLGTHIGGDARERTPGPGGGGMGRRMMSSTPLFTPAPSSSASSLSGAEGGSRPASAKERLVTGGRISLAMGSGLAAMHAALNVLANDLDRRYVQAEEQAAQSSPTGTEQQDAATRDAINSIHSGIQNSVGHRG